MRKRREPKPTPRGLEVLRVLNEAWEKRLQTPGFPRGVLDDFVIFRRFGEWRRGQLRTLEKNGWARRAGCLQCWQITAAGRRAVERSGE